MKFDIFCPSPGPQGAGTQIIVPLHVPFMQVTHTPTLVEFRFFLPLQPQRYPQVPPLGHDPDGRMKILSDMLYIFHL